MNILHLFNFKLFQLILLRKQSMNYLNKISISQHDNCDNIINNTDDKFTNMSIAKKPKLITGELEITSENDGDKSKNTKQLSLHNNYIDNIYNINNTNNVNVK